VHPLAPSDVSQPDRLVGADRVLLVLKRLADHPKGVRLDQLARELGMPKSSLHRALASLRRARLAEQDESSRYRLGLELVRIASVYYQGLDRRSLVLPALEALAARLGETAHYAELDEAEIVYLAKVNPHGSAVHMTSVVGGRNPAHCTGLGKALLAFTLTTDDDVERFVAAHGPLGRRTHQTIVETGALAAELARTRERGYALDDQESEDGINCIAFPIFLDHPARPAGAISVAALLHRTPLEQLVAAAPELRALIEDRLGR
jgi:IclR family acetate operon transcriptional repressor